MKVYVVDGGEPRLIGRADVPEDTGPVYKLPLIGRPSITVDRFIIGTVKHHEAGMPDPIVERAVLLSPYQIAELLPGWHPLAS
ncbi:MAG: hypothetical protein AVDCRST_MAG93-1736 [uncultured Chloroflexia bacterium]|uniref:Uncharacterized protein n=1 Tax=uncultured Chloroflexia bacterium TaxID=1672391 RepID=A0A6J4IHM0_9CHLR|nr:MAG: hypothetical protein AVDCRST_MAG93-1736 [uncultured Chloroflexia bacterium]